MSGNSLLVLTVSAVLISCDLLSGAPRQPEGDPEVVYEDAIFTTDDLNDSAERSGKNDEVTEGEKVVVFHDSVYRVAPHKTEFKVALILPFFYNARTDVERTTSEAMLEYYQGMEMALEDLKRQGLKLRLFIFDNKNDTNKLKEILEQKEVQEMDMIIGPLSEPHLEIASAFSLKTGIPVFSPFTGVSGFTETNPIFYSSIPGSALKARLFVDYLEKYHRDKKLIILRDGGVLDKTFVPVLLEELEKRKSITYMREAYTRNNRWDLLMSRDSANVVYIPSYSKMVVNSSIGRIFAAKKDVTVFGESVWADFEDNDYNFWTKTNVHLMAYTFVDQVDTNVLRFRTRFRETNFEDPSTYAYMGYDQMHFIGDFFMAFGENFPLYISERKFRYLSATFRFIFENGCNENATLYILRYNNNQLTPVN